MSKQPAPIPTPIVQSKPQTEPFSLGNSIKSICNQWTSFKKDITQSDLYKQYDSSRQTFGKEVCHPVNQVWQSTYNELPIETTRLKFSYLQDYSFKERFIFLNVLALGGALLTMRGIAGANVVGKSFRGVRNASLAYIFGGLLVAPEIYNPLMNS